MGILKKIGIILSILAVVFMTLPGEVCLAQSATVSVNNGSSITLNPGGSGSASVSISGIPDLGPGNGLGAFDITVSWDESEIDVTSVSVTPPIIAGTPSGGSVGIVGWYIPPATGSVSVATIYFDVLGDIGDSTTIGVSVNSLGDKDGSSISYNTQGTLVQIVEPPPPPPPPPDQNMLTVRIEGQGTTSPAEGNHYYAEDSVVEITAIPAEGWMFDSWTGDVSDPGSATTTITLAEDEIIVANFVPEADVTPPAILAMAAVNITKTSAEINWLTDEPADSQVEYWASPGELTTLDESLVTEHNVQLTGLTPATEYHYKVLTSDGSGNLTISQEDSFTTLGIPATFEISGWDVSMSKLEVGEQASITFIITNIGDLAGSHQVEFKVGGSIEETKEVTLDPGEDQELSFSISRDIVGTYHGSVDGLSFSFTVAEPEEAWEIWWFYVAGGLGLLFLILIIVLANNARRSKEFTRAAIILANEKKKERNSRELSEIRAARKSKQKKGKKGSKDDIEKSIGDGIVTIKAKAVAELKRTLESKVKERDIYFRIKRETSVLGEKGQFEMSLDKEREGDIVVESEGKKILLIGPNVAQSIIGKVIDCREAPEGISFVVT